MYSYTNNKISENTYSFQIKSQLKKTAYTSTLNEQLHLHPTISMRSFSQLRTTIKTRIKIDESKKNKQTDTPFREPIDKSMIISPRPPAWRMNH